MVLYRIAISDIQFHRDGNQRRIRATDYKQFDFIIPTVPSSIFSNVARIQCCCEEFYN